MVRDTKEILFLCAILLQVKNVESRDIYLCNINHVTYVGQLPGGITVDIQTGRCIPGKIVLTLLEKVLEKDIPVLENQSTKLLF